MVAQGCVNCHNSRADTPFNKWQLGDVRGVLEVSVLIDESLAATNLMIKTITWSFLLYGFALLLVVVFIIKKFVVNPSRSVIETIKHTVETNTENSLNVKGIARELLDSSNMQSAATHQTASTLEEISAMVTKNSNEVDSATKIVQNSTKFTTEGKALSKGVLAAMDRINEGNDQMNAAFEENASQIDEIVGLISEITSKTSVINDIVFQTKLLSFNASVEAARAGESGKGFAVVAEEVGNLAAMSGQASEEISELLTKSSNKAKEIVDKSKERINSLMNINKERVAEGISATENSNQVMVNLFEDFSKINLMLEGISLASQEQVTGVKGISDSMAEIDMVTQTINTSSSKNSTMASEFEKNAEELNNAIVKLEKSIFGSSKSD
jgi:methyl-accepting chemotaxis protein